MAYDGAAETNADREQQPTHRIAAEVIRYGGRGPVYRVTYAGEVLLKVCRCPLLGALTTAGEMIGTGHSPTAVGESVLGAMWTSTLRGASTM